MAGIAVPIANLMARFPECTEEQVAEAFETANQHAGQAGRLLRRQLGRGTPPRSRPPACAAADGAPPPLPTTPHHVNARSSSPVRGKAPEPASAPVVAAGGATLPENWEMRTSKSTGKQYFFNIVSVSSKPNSSSCSIQPRHVRRTSAADAEFVLLIREHLGGPHH